MVCVTHSKTCVSCLCALGALGCKLLAKRTGAHRICTRIRAHECGQISWSSVGGLQLAVHQVQASPTILVLPGLERASQTEAIRYVPHRRMLKPGSECGNEHGNAEGAPQASFRPRRTLRPTNYRAQMGKCLCGALTPRCILGLRVVVLALCVQLFPQIGLSLRYSVRTAQRPRCPEFSRARSGCRTYEVGFL